MGMYRRNLALDGVQFENCTRMQAFVRWVRDGRLGLNFGHEIILG